jgi:uncharacterized protein (DUF427 family)
MRNIPRRPAVDPDMSSGHTVTTTPTDLHVEVRLDGELVAVSDRPVILEETGLPNRYYLRPEDVQVELTPTTFHTTCPFKGEASYWSVTLGGTTHDGIVWGYPEPIPGAEDIAGLVCFYPDRTELTVSEATAP